MIRIGLLSDTHGYLDSRIEAHLASCDEIWHAGDIGNTNVSDRLASIHTLRAVYGNIDGTELRKIHPLVHSFQIENLNVLMIHIGGYPGSYAAGVSKLIHEHHPDLFISGHSHILRVMRDSSNPSMLHMNPGAAGIEGFHRMRTMLRFSISGNKISNVEAIELGLRGALPESA